ncbi:MAG: nicotinate-nicotinamide nucleotide adenylyltransferase [Mariprofundales bacterium]|nr:nicotinate-nicotinamide nucleotide adenylyltransferase [Mariprofundales bacterium]
MRVGIYGGSFDPPHCGHAALARLALECFGLDRLLVVPAAYPVHRALSGCADGATRVSWLVRLFAAEDRITVVDWELAESRPTIQTLRQFADRFPGEVPLLLLGADAVAGVVDWVDYPQHQALCNLGLFSRAGSKPVTPQGWLGTEVSGWQQSPNASAGRVMVVEAAIPPVSATLVREAARRGQSLADLVPSCIVRDIEHYYGNYSDCFWFS